MTTVDIKAELPTLPSLPAVAAGVDREGLLAGLARVGCVEHIAGVDTPAPAARRSSIPDSLPPPILWATR